jgi:hypothetical protein
MIEGELDEGSEREGVGALELEVNEQFVIVGMKASVVGARPHRAG